MSSHMEQFQSVICKCVFVLTLLACHQILSIQARQLRQMNKEESFNNTSQNNVSPTISSSSKSSKAFRPTTPPRPISGDSTDAFRPSTPPKRVSSDSTDAFRPTTPPTPGSGHSTSAFRPTTPGKSPGVGHSFVNNENELVKQVDSSPNGDQHFVTGNREEFRPTSPGHSPGVGHAVGKNAEPNA